MMMLYYGGQLSEDRISYFIFEENLNAGSGYKNIPEGDLGFGSGASAGDALVWALNAQTVGTTTAPIHPVTTKMKTMPAIATIPIRRRSRSPLRPLKA